MHRKLWINIKTGLAAAMTLALLAGCGAVRPAEDMDSAGPAGSVGDVDSTGSAAGADSAGSSGSAVAADSADSTQPVGFAESAESSGGAGFAGEAQGDSEKLPGAGGKEASLEPAASDTGYDVTFCFAGDVNLDENWATTQYLDQCENGIYDCIGPELIEMMLDADIMCLNNEFTYSNGGAPLPDKAYTFRADPGRVEVLGQLGVDTVKLANNHVYDYGAQALLDTFDTLDNAGITYFGAGRNLEEAMEPVYYSIDGKTFALVAASRAEKYKMTPQATETQPGILRCYDTELFKQVIAEAKANADYCIAYVHWGTEYSFALEDVQRKTAKEYLDAGADAIIGAHTHCIQGMEYYDGKPVIYSLGNFWFNDKTLDSMLLRLRFYGDDAERKLQVQVIPAIQKNLTTTIAEGEEKERIFDFLEELSPGITISDEGFVQPVSSGAEAER